MIAVFLLRKRFVEKVKQGVAQAKKVGLRISVSVIFGLPGDSAERAQETLEFVDALAVDNYAHNTLVVHRGTELAKKHDSYGIKINNPYSLPMICDPLLAPLTFTYDVNKVHRLDHEQMINSQAKEGLGVLTKAINGSYKTIRNSLLPEVLICCGDFSNVRRLEDDMSCQTKIVYGQGVNTFFSAPSITDETVSFTVSVANSIHHPKYKLKTTQEMFKLLPKQLKHDFLVKPLGHFDDSGDDKDQIIYTVNTQSDLERLSMLCNEQDIGGAAELPNGSIVLDACRFGGTCRATCFDRILVDEQGGLRTCFSCPSFKKLQDGVKEFNSEIYDLYQQTQTKRGCLKCSARDNCSKCMFLPKDIEQVYCQFKRDNPNLNSFFNQMHLSRKLQHNLF